jgi:hypothetical protein
MNDIKPAKPAPPGAESPTSTRVSDVRPTTADQHKPADRSGLKLHDEVVEKEPEGKQGFDPYNSGAFDYRKTWNRVNPKK